MKAVVGLLFGFICGTVVGGSWAWGRFKGYDNVAPAIGLGMAVFVLALVAFVISSDE